MVDLRFPFEIAARFLRVKGIVQGVGFRPFVYNLAAGLGLNGTVRNTSQGVEIVLEGQPGVIDLFTHALQTQPPPLARIDSVEVSQREVTGIQGFTILDSQPEPGEFQPVPPDIAICDDCRRELFDPKDRRHRYPFINCTNCGPRFSIIQDIPYDRPLTSMSGFKMCPECQAEYDDPADRRFHAQPIACPVCGPSIAYAQVGKKAVYKADALTTARELIRSGGILAVKGLGGYHLACDAANEKAVNTLKERKHRSEKPLAVMAFDIEDHRKVLPGQRRRAQAVGKSAAPGRAARPPAWGFSGRRGRQRPFHLRLHAALHAAAPAALGTGAGVPGDAGDDQRQLERGTHRLRGCRCRRRAWRASPTAS